MYEEDLSLFDTSIYYAAISRAHIVGSVKITLWNGFSALPLQKLFNIRRENIAMINPNAQIFHVGRLAISKKGNPEGVALLKKLLTLAIYCICQYGNSVMVAECDRKLLRGLNLMGIKTKTLAPSIDYLGSETIPIYTTRQWLSAFLAGNDYVKDIVPLYNTTSVLSLKNQLLEHQLG